VNIEKLIELSIGLLIGAAMFNVFFTSQQTPGVVNAVGSNANSILGTLTNKGS
jgi:hypothetical protein